MDLKFAYPEETKKLLKSLCRQPISLSEINQKEHGSIIADELMKNNLAKRILVDIEGVDYIYLEGVKTNAVFKQGRRNFIRVKNER